MVTIPPLVSGYGVTQQRVTVDGPGVSGHGDTGTPEPVVDPLRAALDTALKSAAARQNGLAPLYADLAALAARTDLPPAVRGASEVLLALQVTVDGLDAAVLQKAVAGSGLFLEAALARGSVEPADLKAALLNLRAALQTWLGEAAGRDPVVLRQPPPPPYPGAPPAGQAPERATMGALALPAIAAQLLADTDAALARQTMLQVVSLPDAHLNDAPQRLTLEIPLLTPQGTAVLALQVERDGGRDMTPDPHGPVWRIAFSVDNGEGGAVHARISQIGSRTNVAITAEAAASAAALEAGLPVLQAMLAEAALEPGDLRCRLGAPKKTASAPPGRLLDRAT